MRYSVLLLWIVGVATAWAGSREDTLGKVRDAALERDFAWRQLMTLTDEIGPRLTGSVQADAAVARLAESMKREGFKVTLQPAWVPHWVRGDERATLVDFPGRAEGVTQRLALATLGGSVATPADGIKADVLV